MALWGEMKERIALKLHSPLRLRLVSSAFWNLIASVTARSTSLLASIIVARMLGRDGYGEYVIIWSSLTMFSVFAGFGFGTTAIRHISAARHLHSSSTELLAGQLLSFVFISAALVSSLCFLLAPFIAEMLLASQHLNSALRICSIAIFLSAINSVQYGILTGVEAFWDVALSNVVFGATMVGGVVIGIYFGGLNGSIWAIVLSLTISGILNQYCISRKGIRSFQWSHWKDRFINGSDILSFSLPVFLSGVLIFPLAWACNVLLVNQSNGYREVALFNAANQWKILVIFLPAGLIGAFMPILTSLSAQNERIRFRKVLFTTIKLSTATAILIAFCLILMAKYIMGIYGESFQEGQPILFIVAITGIVESFTTIAGQTMISAGAIWPYLRRYLICTIVVSVTAILFVPAYFSMGLAGAYLAGQTVLAVSLAMYWPRLEKTVKQSNNGLIVPTGQGVV